MKKLLRYISIGILSLLLLIVIVFSGAVLYLHYQEAEIKNSILSALNLHLNTPVVAQEIEIGLFRTFPSFHIQLKEIKANPSQPQDREFLMEAKSISLLFNMRDIISRKYIIQHIEIEGADLNLKQYPDYRVNFNVWKDTASSSANIHFLLQSISIKSTLLRYRDFASDLEVQFYADKIRAKGDFNANSQSFSVKGNYKLLHLSTQGKPILTPQEGRIDCTLQNIRSEKRFEIQKANLSFGRQIVNGIGWVKYAPDQSSLKLKIAGKKLDLKESLNIFPIPESYHTNLLRYLHHGKIDVAVHLSGDYKRNRISIKTQLQAQHLQIQLPQSEQCISDLSFQANFSKNTSPTWTDAQLLLKNIQTEIAGQKISAQLLVSDFIRPEVRLKLHSTGNLEQNPFLKELLPENWQLSGNSELQFDFRHQFPNTSINTWTLNEVKDAQYEGLLCFSDFSAKSPKNGNWQTDTIVVRLRPSLLQIKPGQLAFNQKSFHFSLFAEYPQNWVALFDNYNKNVPLSDEFFLSTDFRFQDLHFNLPAPSADKADEKEETNIFGYFDSIPKDWMRFLVWDSKLEVAHLDIGKERLDNFSVLLRFQDYALHLQDLQCLYQTGSVNLNMDIRYQASTSTLDIGSQGKIQDMDIPQLLSLHEKTQDYAQKITGKISTEYDLHFHYGKDGLLPSSVEAVAELEVKDGGLRNIEKLKKLSVFTGEPQLRDIDFSTLQNTLRISQETIYIPLMQIQSSLAQFSIQGEQTFSGMADYRVNIRLSDLLSRQRRAAKRISEFGIEKTPDNRIQLPLVISGPTDNLKIKYDFKTARELNKLKWKEEKAQTQAVLQNAFKKEKSVPKFSESDTHQMFFTMEEELVKEKPDKKKTPKKKKKPREEKTEEDSDLIIEFDDY